MQFAHINTYARKTSANHKGEGPAWTVSDIVGEASRRPENSPHVEQPTPPLEFKKIGKMADMEERLERYLDRNKVTVKRKGGEAERKARSDAHVLVASVYSWPEHMDYMDKSRFAAWAKDTIDFHRREFGEVDAAPIHTDETFPHLHVYTFSNNAKALHPGEKAKAEAYQNGATKKEANKAYRDAMSAFQDRYYEQVGMRHGLERLGPKRQRVPTKEWRADKRNRLKRADAIRLREEYLERLAEGIDDLEGALIEQEEMVKKLEAEESRIRTVINQCQDALKERAMPRLKKALDAAMGAITKKSEKGSEKPSEAATSIKERLNQWKAEKGLETPSEGLDNPDDPTGPPKI